MAGITYRMMHLALAETEKEEQISVTRALFGISYKKPNKRWIDSFRSKYAEALVPPPGSNWDSVIPATTANEESLPRLVHIVSGGSYPDERLHRVNFYFLLKWTLGTNLRSTLDQLGKLQSEVYPSIVPLSGSVRDMVFLLGDPRNPLPDMVVELLETVVELARKRIGMKHREDFRIIPVTSPLPAPMKTKKELEEEEMKWRRAEREAKLARMTPEERQGYLDMEKAEMDRWHQQYLENEARRDQEEEKEKEKKDADRLASWTRADNFEHNRQNQITHERLTGRR